MFMPGMGKLPLALCGIGLIYSMAQVYRLRSISAWDSNRTLLAFTFSALTLGGLGLTAFELLTSSTIKPGFLLAGGLGLVGALPLTLSELKQTHQTAIRLRLSLIILALVGVTAMFLVPLSVGRWIILPIFIIALIEEILGRWLFYEHLHRRAL
jgi:DMSO reductase anchor subunit